MKQIHFTVLLLILITSCENPPREGLQDNNRNYVNELPKIRCIDSESYSDFLFELNSLEYDNITKEIKLLSDSILGVDFLNAEELQNINEKLKHHYFSFKQEIANRRLVIGSQNLWDLKDGISELTNDSVIPRNLNWKKLLCVNDPLEVNIEKGGLNIQIGIFHCMGKSKKQI